MPDIPTARLIYNLKGDDHEARVDALRQLVERAHEVDAHQALYDASFQADVRLRLIAIPALVARPDDVVFIRLVDLLSDRRGEVRAAAAQALRDLGDPKATLPLIEALGDSNRWVVIAAVEGLGRFGTTAARKPLRKLTGSPDWGIGQAARRALAEIEERDR
ncbi:MAG: HEAT repeat domain-containing protein [Caldilineales bacterium]|nr:HEAT repeat domain-containing protein [Caldilineales bacterium]